MRFLGDMGVSRRVIEWLRANGHDAIHLRDEGLQRMPNGDIFQKGFAEQRIVLTFVLDFGEILAASAGKVVSVVLFRLHHTRTDHVIERLHPTPGPAGSPHVYGHIWVVVGLLAVHPVWGVIALPL